jgi:hypothetical protein
MLAIFPFYLIVYNLCLSVRIETDLPGQTDSMALNDRSEFQNSFGRLFLIFLANGLVQTIVSLQVAGPNRPSDRRLRHSKETGFIVCGLPLWNNKTGHCKPLYLQGSESRPETYPRETGGLLIRDPSARRRWYWRGPPYWNSLDPLLMPTTGLPA